MNLGTLFRQVDVYAADAQPSPMASQLQALIAGHGYDIFRNPAQLNGAVYALDLPETGKAQLALVFSGSTLPDYILNAKSDLNMVDVDNVIHHIVANTGLAYRTVLALVSDVFFACGLSFAIEYGPQLVDGAIAHKLHAVMPSALARVEVEKAAELINAYGALADRGEAESEAAQATAAEAAQILRLLCEAGVPQGFHLLGRCYLYGECGTQPDSRKARELLSLAAEYGVPQAAAALGDVYYDPDAMYAHTGAADRSPQSYLLRDYTLAHHYYTRPGAMAMGKRRQRALMDIYDQHSANRLTLLFSGVLLGLMTLFLALFHQGIFSGAGRLPVGIALLVLAALAYGASIVYNRAKPYNSIRWTVAVQYFIWALYACILALA